MRVNFKIISNLILTDLNLIYLKQIEPMLLIKPVVDCFACRCYVGLYLGGTLTEEGRCPEDIRKRIGLTRAFLGSGPRCWNSLPPVICLTNSADSFKAHLKTHLFAKAYQM